MKISHIKEAARGSWPWILSGLGIDQRCLVNRHGPCPGCGGDDRFRFDDRDGNGGWFCGGGGEWAHGDGLDLLVHVFGWDLKEAADEVARFLNVKENKPIRPMPAPVQKKRDTKPYAIEIWNGAEWGNRVCEHPYAIDKGLATPGPLERGKASGRLVGRNADCLIIPVWKHGSRILQGVQVINTKGVKQSFGDIKGGSLMLGNTLDETLPWFVVEGYADAYSVVFHVFAGQAAAAVSFGSGQLLPAARAVAEIYKPKTLIIVDDAI